MTGYPSRAHRRFLGLTLPPQQVPDHDDDVLPRVVMVAPWLIKAMHEHLTTAGQQRGGILLGVQDGATLYITTLLPNGYSALSISPDPYQPDPQYVLGAVEAAQQQATVPVDWVGSWAMPADTRLTPEWCERVWDGYVARGLLPWGTPLITFGQTTEGLVYEAWIDYGEGRTHLSIQRQQGDALS